MSGQDEWNPELWLPTRAGKMELSYPLGTTRRVPQGKFPRKPYNKSFTDQACSVKMTGYWPRSFFACLWTSTSKNLANIQPSWPNKLGQQPIYITSRPTIKFFILLSRPIACERRPISGFRLSPPKNTVCELEPRNDFRDVKTKIHRQNMTLAYTRDAAGTGDKFYFSAERSDSRK